MLRSLPTQSLSSLHLLRATHALRSLTSTSTSRSVSIAAPHAQLLAREAENKTNGRLNTEAAAAAGGGKWDPLAIWIASALGVAGLGYQLGISRPAETLKLEASKAALGRMDEGNQTRFRAWLDGDRSDTSSRQGTSSSSSSSSSSPSKGIRNVSFDQCFQDQHSSAIGVSSAEFGVFTTSRVPSFGRAQRWLTRLLSLGFFGKEHLVAEFNMSRCISVASLIPNSNKEDADIGKRDTTTTTTTTTTTKADRSSAEDILVEAFLSHTLKEVEVITLFLLLQERRGNASAFAPYIQMLPSASTSEAQSPMNFMSAGKEDLVWIRGTNLFHAVTAFQQQMAKDFPTRISPILKAMMDTSAADEKGLGLTDQSVTYEEFVNASALVWSRVVAVPFRAQDGSVVEIHSLVPGLDFVNHSCRQANSRWEYQQQGDADLAQVIEEGLEGSIQLYATKALSKGEQLYMNYGDKSNEQLMFQYGFAEDDNPNDSLVLDLRKLLLQSFSAEQREEGSARLAQALERDLPTKAFLAAKDIDKHGNAQALPENFMKTLAILVEPDQEVDQVSAGRFTFGALTLMSKLLQTTIYNLESDEHGTGTVESDVSLLEKDEALAPEDARKMSRQHYMCVLYRMQQKKIARAYLALAQKELSKVF